MHQLAVDHVQVPINMVLSNHEISRGIEPETYKLDIRRKLLSSNFSYHRPCSETNFKDCNVLDGACLMFRGNQDSKAIVKMNESNSASLHDAIQHTSQAGSSLRSTAQQTELACRHTSAARTQRPRPPLLETGLPEHISGEFGLHSPRWPDGLRGYDDNLLCQFINDSTKEQRVLQSITLPFPIPPRSSIFSSVCALLLNKQVPPQHGKKVSTLSVASDTICRICFGGESSERLVRPCQCRGTIAAVHRACLERWLLQAASSYCELCRHHYLVTRRHKWSWFRSLLEWIRSEHGYALVTDTCRGVALGAASVAVTSRALAACDKVLQAGAEVGGGTSVAANVMSSLVIGVIGAVNGLLTTWMLLKIQEHQSSWHSWRASSLTLHVTLAEEVTPCPSPQLSDTTIVPEGTDKATNVSHSLAIATPLTLSDQPEIN